MKNTNTSFKTLLAAGLLALCLLLQPAASATLTAAAIGAPETGAGQASPGAEDAQPGEAEPQPGAEPQAPAGPGEGEPAEATGPETPPQPDPDDPGPEPGQQPPAPSPAPPETEEAEETKEADSPAEPADETEPPSDDNEEEGEEAGPSAALPAALPIAPLAEATRDLRSLLQNGDSILANWSLAFENGNDNVQIGDSFTLEFWLQFPEYITGQLQAGDYYDIQMPAGLNVNAAASGTYPIVGPDGATVVAEVELLDDGTLRIVFNENIALFGPDSDTPIEEGYFYVTGAVTDEITNEGGTTTITVPGEEELPGVEVTVRPDVETSIDKAGYFDRTDNPQSVTWQVYANKDMSSLTGFTLIESFPAGVTYESATVYTYRIDLDGNMLGDPIPLDPSLYTIDAAGNITFSGTVDYPVYVEYVTTIDEAIKPGNTGGTIELENTVTQSSNEAASQEAESSLEADYSEFMRKSVYGYDSENQTFTWEIRYNTRSDSLEPGTYIRDELPSGLVLTDDDGDFTTSFTLYEMVYDANGNIVQGPPLDPALYTLVPTADGTGWEILFPNGLDVPVLIRFETAITDIVDETIPYRNEITDGTYTTGGNGNATQQGVIKTHTADPSTNTITWTLRINRNHYNMHDFVLTDDIFSGHEFTSLADLVVVDNGGPNGEGAGTVLTLGTDYDAILSSPNFSLEFLAPDYNPTDHSFTITYKTRYNAAELPAGSFLNNRAVINWVDDDDNPHTSTDNDRYSPSTEARQNGAKQGEYNATTKEITWTIRLNYGNLELLNAYLEDQIEPDQTYIQDSLEIYHYTVTPNTGEPVRGDPFTPEELAALTITQPGDGNNQTLTIEFPDAQVAQGAYYWIEFRTSLEGQYIGTEAFTNTASWNNDTTPDFNLEAEVSVANGGTFVGKQGTQDGDGVHWSITVNASQSTLQNVVVTDIPSANQLVDLSSVVVYGTNVAENGGISINYNEVLTPGVDYTATYEQNPVTDEFELVVAFLGEQGQLYQTISRPYIITFDVTVLVGEGESRPTISNDVTIAADAEQEVDQPAEDELVVNVGQGGGFVTGRVGTVTIQKTDSVTGGGVPGVTFQLYFDENGAPGDVAGPPVTTGADGTAVYNALVYGTYWIEELDNPSGYSLLTPNPQILVVNGAANAITVPVTNTPSIATLTKVDGSVTPQTPLEGAEYALYVYNETTLEWDQIIRPGESFTTGADGTLVITALPMGRYQLIETTAPTGYVPDADPILFTISADADGQLITVFDEPNADDDAATTHENVPTRVLIRKWDQYGPEGQAGDGNGLFLPGAAFILQQEIDGAWVRLDPEGFYTSDENGEIEIERLPVGHYRVIEVSAPEGFARHTEPLEFYVGQNPDGTFTYDVVEDFRNWPIIVRLTKVDAETGALLAGAIFELWEQNDETGEFERIRENETFYTDQDGILTIGRMNVGATYQLREVTPPPGYSLNPEAAQFTVEYDILEEEFTIIEIDGYPNIPSAVGLVKTDAADETLYLEGAEFTLEAQNAETGAWAPLYEGLVTDANGGISLSALPAGTYRFVETRAPAGYLLNPAPIEFTLAPDENGQLLPYLAQATNTLNETGFTKVDETGAPLANAVFRLEAYSEGTDTWARIRAGEDFTSDETGLVTVSGLAPGRYRWVETEAPTGYLLLDAPVEFTVDEFAQTNTLLAPVANAQSGAAGVKVNQAGQGLPGAAFALYRQDGGSWVRVQLMQEPLSGPDGAITLLGLAPGAYRLVETAAPAGYQLLAEPIDFTLTGGETALLSLGEIVNLATPPPVVPPAEEDDDEDTSTGATGGSTGAVAVLAATGDGANPAWWVLLGGLAVAMLLLFLFYRRKSNRS